MTNPERMIWAATFAAAYVAEVRSLTRMDVELDAEIAGRAAKLATEALTALHDAKFNTVSMGRDQMSLDAVSALEKFEVES